MNKNEICLILLRNDIIKSRRVSDALGDLEHVDGLDIVHVKMFMPTREQIVSHYDKDDLWLMKVGEKVRSFRKATGLPLEKEALEYGKMVLESLISYNTEGPMVAVVLRGLEACRKLREIVGDTDPDRANPGTMRAKYGRDSVRRASSEARAIRNGIHCSEDDFDGLREVRIFCPELQFIDLLV